MKSITLLWFNITTMGDKETKTEQFIVKKKTSDVKLLGGREKVYQLIHSTIDDKVIEKKYKSKKK